MKINLHFLPEKPVTSCEVITFHVNERGDLYHVCNIHYSAKFGMFNTYEWSEIDDADYEYQKSIVAWAYMKDVEEELFNEIQR